MTIITRSRGIKNKLFTLKEYLYVNSPFNQNLTKERSDIKILFEAYVTSAAIENSHSD